MSYRYCLYSIIIYDFETIHWFSRLKFPLLYQTKLVRFACPTLNCSNVINGSMRGFLFCNKIKTLYRLGKEHGKMLLRGKKKNMTHLFVIILPLIYFFLKKFCLLKLLPTDSGRRLK